MSKKRFTDTGIWDKSWFMKLNPAIKCLVKYVRDKCDLAGVWDPNFELAIIQIGENVCENDLLNIDSGKQFEKLPNGKIFCIGFLNFQYGEKLNPNSPVHKKILDILSKNKIDFNTLSDRVCNTLQEEEEDKEEDKEEVKEEEGGIGISEKDFVKVYFDWFEHQFSIKPQYDGSDGIAMKSLCKYLRSNNKGDPGNELKAFRFILENWSLLEDFYQKQTRVRQINSNIQNIIIQIKKAIKKKNGSTNESTRKFAETLASYSWNKAANV